MARCIKPFNLDHVCGWVTSEGEREIDRDRVRQRDREIDRDNKDIDRER